MREGPWAGRGHAIVDRLVSVVFPFEFKRVGRPIRGTSDPVAVRSDSATRRGTVPGNQQEERENLFNEFGERPAIGKPIGG
jgi:hypothetical protein